MQVLIIDDEASIRNSMCEYFEDFGIDVTAVGSAEAALEALNSHCFDVAVVDIRLPGIDGDALILKAHGIVPTLRFIIHTGSVEYRLNNALRSIGLNKAHIFIKPVADLATLVNAVKSLADHPPQEAS